MVHDRAFRVSRLQGPHQFPLSARALLLCGHQPEAEAQQGLLRAAVHHQPVDRGRNQRRSHGGHRAFGRHCQDEPRERGSDGKSCLPGELSRML